VVAKGEHQDVVIPELARSVTIKNSGLLIGQITIVRCTVRIEQAIAGAMAKERNARELGSRLNVSFKSSPHRIGTIYHSGRATRAGDALRGDPCTVHKGVVVGS
jgi:hypothetical protein